MSPELLQASLDAGNAAVALRAHCSRYIEPLPAIRLADGTTARRARRDAHVVEWRADPKPAPPPPGEDHARGAVGPRTFWLCVGLVALAGALCCYWSLAC